MQTTESHVSWDVEGWVKAAMCAWAREYEEIQIARYTQDGQSWMEILIDHVPIARVEVRKIPTLVR